MSVLPIHKNLTAVREILRQLYESQFDIFYRLFVAEEILAPQIISENDADSLLSANLIRRENEKIIANFRITKIYDLFIATDFPTFNGEDRVWYLLDDESILFAKNIPDCTGQRVLDVGCGSGVLGIMASRNHAREVISVDISARAQHLTMFNAALNDCNNLVAKNIDIQSFKNTEPFDYILFNPPFVPMPNNTHYMLSGEGGLDGLKLVHEFFSCLPNLVHEKTAISIISMSPGNDCISALERLIVSRYYGKPFHISVSDIYGANAPIDIAYEPFRGELEFNTWKKWLHEKQYSHMHYLLINIFPSAHYCFQRTLFQPKLEETKDSGSWRAMYYVIQNTKDHA